MGGHLLAGEFARRTRLSAAKALRLRGQGLLVPERVDEVTGYRCHHRDTGPGWRTTSGTAGRWWRC